MSRESSSARILVGIIVGLLVLKNVSISRNARNLQLPSAAVTVEAIHQEDSSSLPTARFVEPKQSEAKDVSTTIPGEQQAECSPIYLLPPANDAVRTKGEHAHFVIDGVRKSPYFRITTKNTEGSLWIFDQMRTGGDCKTKLNEIGNATVARRKMYGDRLTAPDNERNWKLYHLDWSDGVYHWVCDGMDKLVGKENIRYATRSIVRNRAVKIKQGRDGVNYTHIEQGKIEKFARCNVKHIPYAVRTDEVEAIASVLKEDYKMAFEQPFPSESWNLADLDRSKGNNVCHFWPVKGEGWEVHHQLRDAVSQTIDRMSKSSKNLTALVESSAATGNKGEQGRIRIQRPYVQAMLRCQIVVVTQRDFHEDHYRLMEALASGAMVMTDPMLSLPNGFADGDNVIFFQNMTDLETKILHYAHHDEDRLEVARKGWTEAMSRHRSWHFVEDLIFGEIRTTGMQTPAGNECK